MFPLIDFGRLRAQMHSADARQLQAFHTYKQTVLTALEGGKGIGAVIQSTQIGFCRHYALRIPDPFRSPGD